MRLAEVDSIYVSRRECALVHINMGEKLDSINKGINVNRQSVDKLNKVLLGNGDEGLVLQFNKLVWRNQLIDKGTTIIVGVLSTLITYYLVKLVGL